MWQRFWLCGILGLTAVACEPPPRSVPALPPGVDPASLYKPSEEDVAAALGEGGEEAGVGAKAEAEKVKAPTAAPDIGDVEARTTPSGLKIQVVRPGEGETVAEKGKRVTVHYNGWVQGGSLFDSSRDRKAAFQFTLGQGDVIKGWDEGVAGMKLHEVRRLTIPPDLAYGNKDRRSSGKGYSSIPAGSTLVFDIEFLGVEKPRGPAKAESEQAQAKSEQ